MYLRGDRLFLQPLVTNLPSYTRDSMEFIKMIKSIQQIEETHILVTMDIISPLLFLHFALALLLLLIYLYCIVHAFLSVLSVCLLQRQHTQAHTAAKGTSHVQIGHGHAELRSHTACAV